MSTHRDPPRLREGNDPLEGGLRSALRNASEDGPSAAQMEALIDGTLNGLSAGGAGAVASSGAQGALLQSGWVKLSLVLCALGGSAYWTLAPRAPEEPTRVEAASSAAETPPAAGHFEGSTASPRHAAKGENEGAPLGPADPASHHSPKEQAESDSPTLTPIVEPLAMPAPVETPRHDATHGAERSAPDEPRPPSKELGGPRGDSTAAPPTPSTHLASPTLSARGTSTAPTQRASRRRPQREAADNTAASSPATADELQLLSRAQHALLSQPRMALALLRQHRRQHPQSTLAQERDAMELEALARVDPTDGLHDQARTFLRRYPNSPHADRVRALLARSK